MATTPSSRDPLRPPELETLLPGAAEQVLGAPPTAQHVEAALKHAIAADTNVLSRGAARPSDGHPSIRTPRGRYTNETLSPVLRRWVIRGFLGIAGAVFAVLMIRHSRKERQEAPVFTGTRYATVAAERATVTLDDGTHVILAPQSALRVARGFGVTSRAVMLDGEAYFDVRTDRATPFTVQTAGVTTRVLGTAFAVRHYATDARTQVAVTSGKVSVANHTSLRQGLTLTAGAVATATDSSVALLSSDSASAYAAWVTGQLVFRAAPMSDVLATLSRWYGYRFQIADSALVHQNVTAVLDAESSAKALSTIKLLLNIDFAFDGDVVILRTHVPHSSPDARRRDGSHILTPPHIEVGR